MLAFENAHRRAKSVAFFPLHVTAHEFGKLAVAGAVARFQMRDNASDIGGNFEARFHGFVLLFRRCVASRCEASRGVAERGGVLRGVAERKV
jgi:hypothetical protein